MSSSPSSKPVLLTGASGFVGRHLWPELVRSGREVRCLTRNRNKAQARWPEKIWVEGDIRNADDLKRAFAGCSDAFYLVHGMEQGEGDLREQELSESECFAAAAAEAGLERIVYLGGMRPRGEVSDHLHSRLDVGKTLRNGATPTVELRASMIIGYGSVSWNIVRDVSARMPILIVPPWIESRTQPIAIGDVVAALLLALQLSLSGSASFDLPGPETMSAKEILLRSARALGRSKPLMMKLPGLTPWLSSQFVRFITKADWAVVRQIVVGLDDDMLARDHRFWNLTGYTELTSFDRAVDLALRKEREAGPMVGFWGAVERRLCRVPDADAGG